MINLDLSNYTEIDRNIVDMEASKNDICGTDTINVIFPNKSFKLKDDTFNQCCITPYFGSYENLNYCTYIGHRCFSGCVLIDEFIISKDCVIETDSFDCNNYSIV